jgi:hypothetical protein
LHDSGLVEPVPTRERCDPGLRLPSSAWDHCFSPFRACSRSM